MKWTEMIVDIIAWICITVMFLGLAQCASGVLWHG